MTENPGGSGTGEVRPMLGTGLRAFLIVCASVLGSHAFLMRSNWYVAGVFAYMTAAMAAYGLTGRRPRWFGSRP